MKTTGALNMSVENEENILKIMLFFDLFFSFSNHYDLNIISYAKIEFLI